MVVYHNDHIDRVSVGDKMTYLEMPILIRWSKEDNSYVAIVLGVEGLSAFGETPEEALKELFVACEGYFNLGK